METKSKSEILQSMNYLITSGLSDTKDTADIGEYEERKTGKIVKWTIQILNPETMIDADGVKWIRAPGE